ncbi:Uma2 family endonuclease [Streptomyces sp. NPDC021056]|uniref:Uma2 family endonuclease n=1 Tax=Streptomyces sp. NPDC021056 TaxID=3155012 RepID=UPI0033D38477
MTVLEDRIAMAESDNESTLDERSSRTSMSSCGPSYPRKRVKSDVRIDYPGHLNGFATDVTVVKEGAAKTEKGHWRHEDVEFVAEVISRGTAANDYGPKKTAYAVADPYKGTCYVYTQPKEGDYITRTKVDFGTDIDLTGTVVDLTLKTDEFPRD